MISENEAFELLKQNNVVAIPTETVYGLAARIDSDDALKKIFSTKKRPFFDPLIVHIGSIEMAKKYTTHWNDCADVLAKNFWPGPLTLVLPKNDKVSPLITAGLSSVGLRWPQHPVTESLIHKLTVPLAAPSANLFGRTSPSTAQHVVDEFKNEVPVLDGGSCVIGIESTVVGIEDNNVYIYRPGKITLQDIQRVLSENKIHIKVSSKASSVAPGQLENHYQPSVPLIISQSMDSLKNYLHTELKLALNQCVELKLDTSADLFARQMYAQLRDFSKDFKAIYIIETPDQNKSGLWQAIWDRLHKASSQHLV